MLLLVKRVHASRALTTCDVSLFVESTIFIRSTCVELDFEKHFVTQGLSKAYLVLLMLTVHSVVWRHDFKSYPCYSASTYRALVLDEIALPSDALLSGTKVHHLASKIENTHRRYVSNHVDSSITYAHVL